MGKELQQLLHLQKLQDHLHFWDWNQGGGVAELTLQRIHHIWKFQDYLHLQDWSQGGGVALLGFSVDS